MVNAYKPTPAGQKDFDEFFAPLSKSLRTLEKERTLCRSHISVRSGTDLDEYLYSNTSIYKSPAAKRV